MTAQTGDDAPATRQQADMIWAGMLVTWEPGGLMRLHLGHRRNFLVLKRSDLAALAAYDATVDEDGTIPTPERDSTAPPARHDTDIAQEK